MLNTKITIMESYTNCSEVAPPVANTADDFYCKADAG